MTFEEINDLTLFQLAVLLGAITQEHGRITVKADQVAGLVGKK